MSKLDTLEKMLKPLNIEIQKKDKKYNLVLVKSFGKIRITRPVLNAPCSENDLAELAESIVKSDGEKFNECLVNIRKQGIFRRLFIANISKKEAKNDNSKTSPQAKSGASPGEKEKTTKSNDSKANKETEKKEVEKEETEKEEKNDNPNETKDLNNK